MSSPVVHAKVSNRGQTSLPAQLRHRWGIETGGDVAFVDLGDSALILPGGMDQAKAELKRVLSERYDSGLAAISDPDLADQ
jgi:bifunctional DNA-binding transcriptional regulator/antitoxin component of YhaV-PrlF toxin-antitoxin module